MRFAGRVKPAVRTTPRCRKPRFASPGTGSQALRPAATSPSFGPAIDSKTRRGSTRLIRGQRAPYQGWVSRGMLKRPPAPVVVMARSGASAAILTLIAPTSPHLRVATSITTGHGGWYQLKVRTGGAAVSFLLNTGGYIKRVDH